jgi:hypothetical protein
MSGSMPQVMTREQARSAGSALAAVRVGFGVLAWLAPGLAVRPWAGATAANDPGGRLLGRSLGIRDIALGAGAILAQRHDTPVRGWVEAGALSDTGDLLATVFAFGKLPKLTRWLILAITVGAVVAGGLIAPCIDRED